GSTAGGFGSNFKTSVQLLNPTSAPLTGRLIFHRSGTAGSPNDPALAITIGSGEVTALADVLPSMGQTGLGSMDLVMTGAQLPIVISRIYNDQGANGTSGAFEELVPSTTSGAGTRILTPGTVGFLLTPIEPARTRLNVGVRAV